MHMVHPLVEMFCHAVEMSGSHISVVWLEYISVFQIEIMFYLGQYRGTNETADKQSTNITLSSWEQDQNIWKMLSVKSVWICVHSLSMELVYLYEIVSPTCPIFQGG